MSAAFKGTTLIMGEALIRGKRFPMDTSSSIRHRFNVEIPRGNFVEVSSILKGESMWKL